MKKINFLIAIILIGVSLEAKVWRVNNNPGIDADFSAFAAAQNAASNGDTLYFEGSAFTYGNIVMSKKLTLIGPGYFLSQNPETQAIFISAKFGTINFNTGSEESVITGLEVQNSITIATNKISIKRCLTFRITINASTLSIGNILILNNYISTGTSLSDGINCTGNLPIYNLIISNNIIKIWNGRDISLSENVSGVISNNVFTDDISCHNFIISNNIQTSGTQQINNNVYFNNIGNSTQFPVGNGNQRNMDMTVVFVGATGQSTDGQWVLKTGSPAIGAANDGGDCGVFGGPSPYILSGLPEIPAIYELTMPVSGNNIDGIPVTIKIKSH